MYFYGFNIILIIIYLRIFFITLLLDRLPIGQDRLKISVQFCEYFHTNQQGFHSLVLQNLVGEFVHNIIMKVQADGVENECHEWKLHDQGSMFSSQNSATL